MSDPRVPEDRPAKAAQQFLDGQVAQAGCPSGADLKAPEIPDELWERCLRAYYRAPKELASLALLESMTDCPKWLREACSVAYEAGKVARLPWNPLEVQAVDLDQVNP